MKQYSMIFSVVAFLLLMMSKQTLSLNNDPSWNIPDSFEAGYTPQGESE